MPKFPRNRDGGQWRLRWEPKDGGFRAWVESHPEVEVFAQSWKDAQQALYDAVDEKLHAGEWTADWFPPPPVDERYPYSVHPDYVMMVADGSYVLEGEPIDYFTAGRCVRCTRPKGDRNASPLRVSVNFLAGIMAGCPRRSKVRTLDIFREETLKALSTRHLHDVEVRPVVRADRGKSQLFELNPATVVDPIAVKGIKLFGQRCKVCGAYSPFHNLGEGKYVIVYPAAAIPKGAECLWVDREQPHLCVRVEWWAKTRNDKAFRGVVTSPLLVADAAHIDLHPPDPMLEVLR